MKAKNKRKFWMLLLGILFLMIPAVIWGLWIYVFENNPYVSQSEKVKIYFSFFPQFLRDNSKLFITVLISSFLAIVFAIISMVRSSVSYKIIGIIIIIVAFLIILLQLFSMM